MTHDDTKLTYNYKNIVSLYKGGMAWPKVSKYFGKQHPAAYRYVQRRTVEGKENKAYRKDVTIEEERTYLDTRSMSVKDWNIHYLKKFPLDHQIENQQTFRKGHTILNDPRQHGKTVYSIEPHLTREMCESRFYNIDRPWMYITHSIKKARKMLMTIRYGLLTNPRIRKDYGDLVDISREQGMALIQNTTNELNLTTLKDKELISLQVLSVNSNVRGETTYGCIIDDPVDIKELREKRESVQRATEDFMLWFKTKILPLVKGPIYIIGTRYDINDLYVLCKEMRIFNYISRRALIGNIPAYNIPDIEYDEDNNEIPLNPQDIIIEEDITKRLLAPELFVTDKLNPRRSGSVSQNFILNLFLMGDIIFQQELQNNPLPMGHDIDFNDLINYQLLPPVRSPADIKWVIFCDPGAGETKKADHTSFVAIGEYHRNFYIHDIVFGHWTGKKKQEKLEAFVVKLAKDVQVTPDHIRVCIETVMNQRDFFQRIRDECWITPIAIDPKGRGKKVDRIRYGLGQDMENGKVYLNHYCQSRQQLKTEIDGFPSIHPDIIDAGDQGIFFFKSKYMTGSGVRLTI